MSSDGLRIWYSLVQADGTPFSNSTADKVYVKSTDDIADLRKAIKAENENKLAKVDSSDLKVFKNQAELSGEPLDEEILITDLEEAGKKKMSALLVLIPESHVSSRLSPDTSLASTAKRQRLDELSSRLKSFVNAKLIDQCISSGYNAYLPILDEKIQRLFVRKCYEDVFGLLLEGIVAGVTWFGISGTPGIGKSLFFIYILFRIMNDDSPWKPKRIVYQKGDEFECYDLENHDVVGPTDGSVITNLICRSDTLYVADGRDTRPRMSACITLFISSPRSDHFKGFVKQQRATVCYFPVWTLEELSVCRQKCYPLFPPDVLAERFRIYGGVARFAFYDFKAGVPYVREDPSEMEAALGDADAVKSLRAVGAPSKMFETTHTLLHMIVGERQGFPYRFLFVDIASKYVGEQLWDRHYEEMIANLRAMIGGMPDEISRHLFEIQSHRIFSKGGMTLKCRNLEDDTESELELDKLSGDRTSMGKNNLPSPPLISYYEPTDDDQFPAVDSISKQGMFQFTVGAEHPIRGVRVLKQLCGLYDDPKLYFVVPPHRFAKFQKQKFLDKQGSTQVIAVPGLKQYVLQLEV
ncbi:hypothetical protein MIR68_010762 [Amoeboaphelidium protococcarum]|nr:hypothetical protein MIR68_010762 [Amoeboaphelidium protococcarum]